MKRLTPLKRIEPMKRCRRYLQDVKQVSETEIEARVQEYAREHCASATGKCNGCQHRQSAAFFGDPNGDDWCYLAEGNLRQSRVDMCPAIN